MKGVDARMEELLATMAIVNGDHGQHNESLEPMRKALLAWKKGTQSNNTQEPISVTTGGDAGSVTVQPTRQGETHLTPAFRNTMKGKVEVYTQRRKLGTC